MDGIVASNFVLQEDYGLRLDAGATERFKKLVRAQMLCNVASTALHDEPHQTLPQEARAQQILDCYLSYQWLVASMFIPGYGVPGASTRAGISIQG